MGIPRCWRLSLFSLGFCCCVLMVAGQNIVESTEVEALRIIKSTLIDPNGNLISWNHGDPCTSNWTGVVCFNSTLANGYLHVQELRLMGLNLSGTLAPEIGQLAYMETLNFMWNNISGSIPKEIGNIKSLVFLLLSGNQLTGELPEELGHLSNLNRIQIDQNHINGLLPKSFANLTQALHFHMNNNSISGQIPPEISSLPKLIHILLDNNNLSGPLPPELSQLPSLKILQLDNNNLGGSTIPDSYGNMSKLLKLSLRNCSLQGHIPDFSTIPKLGYLDLSSNQLNGSIPSNKLSENITTIDLSNNKLTGNIPSKFSSLPNLQKLDLRNNNFTNISGTASLPSNNTLRLRGNPLCLNDSLAQFCGSQSANDTDTLSQTNFTGPCRIQSCPPPFQYSGSLPGDCFCAAPFLVGYRLKSPGFSDFLPFRTTFETYLTDGLNINFSQLYLDSIRWQEGPRLLMYLKIFPIYLDPSSTNTFNGSEIQRLVNMFTSWGIPDSDLFGPYELINYTLPYHCTSVNVTCSSRGRSKDALVGGIILGVISGVLTLFAIVTFSLLIVRMQRNSHTVPEEDSSEITMEIDCVRSFTYGEIALAANNFSDSNVVGRGGFGVVYRGVLADRVVAIKRAQEASLQGRQEFQTEIKLLSRLHHRNLVSLLGYCHEKGEQMLIYEYMSMGTLRDILSARSRDPPNFTTRLRIALDSAKGILYLHTEASPPVFHRDIKSSNILLDSQGTTKVADFGLSRLAPVPDEEGRTPSHVSTVPKGTPGYIDPEYWRTHQLTNKSDVYSLGVVFLELLTGMQAISHGKNLVDEVRRAHEKGEILSVIDRRLGPYPHDRLEQFLDLALQCCQRQPDARPMIREVARRLEDIKNAMEHESGNNNTEFIRSMDIDSSLPSASTSRSSTGYLSWSTVDVEATIERAPPWH